MFPDEGVLSFPAVMATAILALIVGLILHFTTAF